MRSVDVSKKSRMEIARGWLWLWIVAVGILYAAPSAAAAQQSAGEKSGPLSPVQTLKRYQLSDLQLAPDENTIAFTVTEPVKGTERKSNIWLYDVKNRSTRRFTASEKSDRRPRFSPDGTTVAFLSSRGGASQIYLIPIDGGEAEALTETKTGILSFEWSPDGTRIAFLSTDPRTEEEEKKLKEKDDAFVVDKDERDPRLRIIDLKSKNVDTLTEKGLRISEFVWMPDGKGILLSATDHKRRDLFSNQLYTITISSRRLRKIATPAGPFGHIEILPDGKTLAYLGARSADGPDPHDLFVRPLEGGTAVNLTGASIDRPISSFHRRKDGRFLALGQNGFATTFYDVTPSGEAKALQAFDVDPGREFVLGSGLLAFVGGTAVKAPELWVSADSAPASRATHFNKEWDSIPLVEPEIVHYPSFDGKMIEAALLKPAGYGAGTRVPFVVLVHGGPAGRFSNSFQAWSQLLAARGYAVLMPNIRGSLGYGHDFLTVNRYDWGGDDFKDVMAGVDYVVNQGIADPDRMGIGGWSYGGYMAAWAITQTDRFKASVSGAPMTDLASEFGTESPGVNIGDTWALGNPYENLELFNSRSPVVFVKNVKTPVLLLNGEEDPTDPIGQCEQFYRGLRRYNAEVEFVRYPRMLHGPREEKHQLDIMNRMIAWFEKYLK